MSDLTNTAWQFDSYATPINSAIRTVTGTSDNEVTFSTNIIINSPATGRWSSTYLELGYYPMFNYNHTIAMANAGFYSYSNTYQGGWYSGAPIVTFYDGTDNTSSTLYNFMCSAATQISTVNVTYNLGGHGTDFTKVAGVGSYIYQPADPTAEGYTFDGWYKDSSFATAWDFSTDTVSSATTVYAKWVAASHDITFDMQGHGTQIAVQTVASGQAGTCPTAPTESGYVFGGWYTEAACTNAYNWSTIVTEDITLYAKWTAQYTVTFDVQSKGTAPASQTILEGGLVTEPTAPTTTAYIFSGWYKESACTNAWDFASDTVTANTTLYAKWVTATYTITYNLDGGTATNPSTYTIETASFTLNNPTKGDYSFDGWTGTDLSEVTQTVTIAQGSTGNRTYTANYTALVTTYTATFVMNGHGTQVAPQTIIEGQTVTQPTAPTETGYTFNGWYSDSALTTLYDFSTAVYENKTIYAKWTAIPQYTVTFNLLGHGSAIASQTVYSGSTATRPTDPTADGYIFKGWYSNASLTTLFDFTTPITANITLYAKWYEIPVLDYFGNRHNENFIYKRVAFSNWQEHEAYGYITSGSVEYASDADLKVTGSFDFEGYELPSVNDMLRVYYSFTDDNGLEFYEPIATLLVSYASLGYLDTLQGLKASGSLEGSSVLKILQDKITGVPYTIKKNANAVYEAENILKDCGLQTNTTPSGFALSTDHTFDAGTTYLDMVNWLLETAGYVDAYPDPNGIIQLKSQDDIDNASVSFTFKNDDKSIMYPEVDAENDWQNTPNVVKLLYNVEDACIVSEARNVTGSRASLEARGEREVTYFEEVSDIGDGSKVNLMKSLAESTLISKSADIEYVTISHAYVPIAVHDIIGIKYSDTEWTGHADNISIDLSPATKTQTKIKRVLTDDITITSSATVYRSE